MLLFGGQTIYKHMFHMNRHVEKYTTSLLESKLGLTRHKLIALALLLGSDYTDGIKGIGPVNGIEIVQTFCLQADSVTEGLAAFKQWMYSTEVETEPLQKPNMDTMAYGEYVDAKKAWFKFKVWCCCLICMRTPW